MLSKIRKNANKYGEAITSHDLLKCAAVFFMTVDHVGFFFFPDELWWRAFGRICVPIWFFLLGFSRPSSPRKDLLWLCLLMIMADIAFVSPIFPVNILATIYVARYVINYMSMRDKDAFMLLIFSFSCIVMVPLTDRFIEYGSLVFFFSLAGYYQRFFPKHWLGTATMVLGWAVFSWYQAYLFKMDMVQSVAMAIMLAVTCVLLLRFKTQNTAFNGANAGGTLMRYLGRNTHYYYAFHYIALQAIDAALNPPASWQIKWFYPLF